MAIFRTGMDAGTKQEWASLVGALAHLYRGEVARAEGWRARLDTTTNWALTTAAAVISFGLGTTASPHAVILIGMYMVLNFLLIEARRYRSWDVYLRRVRLLESSLFAPMLRGEPVEVHRLRELAAAMEAPRIQVSFSTALAQRLKRAYGPVFGVLLAAWAVKLMLLGPNEGILARMRVGRVPGALVAAVVCLTYLALLALVGLSVAVRPPSTELRPARRKQRPLREVFMRETTKEAAVHGKTPGGGTA